MSTSLPSPNHDVDHSRDLQLTRTSFILPHGLGYNQIQISTKTSSIIESQQRQQLPVVWDLILYDINSKTVVLQNRSNGVITVYQPTIPQLPNISSNHNYGMDRDYFTTHNMNPISSYNTRYKKNINLGNNASPGISHDDVTTTPTNNDLNFDHEMCPLCQQPIWSERKSHTKSFISQDYFERIQSSVSSIPFSSSKQQSSSTHPGLSQAAFNQGYYETFFKEQWQLGRGGYGSVFLCQHVLEGINLGLYAIKKIPVGNSIEYLTKVLHEVKSLQGLEHINIVSYKHSWIENCKLGNLVPTVPCLFLLMQYANRGSLSDWLYHGVPGSPILSPIMSPINGVRSSGGRLRQRMGISPPTLSLTSTSCEEETETSHGSPSSPPPTFLNEEFLWHFLIDACLGLNYLHEAGIIHKDLKPDNFLLVDDNRCSVDEFDRVRPRLLISDFGESEALQHLKGVNVRERSGYTGTKQYSAPELRFLDPSTNKPREVDSKCDIYSLGLILFVMIYGRLPFIERDNLTGMTEADLDEVALNDMKHIEDFIPDNCICQNLLIGMLKFNPKDRFTIDEVLSHEDIRIHDTDRRCAEFYPATVASYVKSSLYESKEKAMFYIPSYFGYTENII